MDDQMKEFLDGVTGAVEANDYEALCLWSENRQRDKPLSWRQELSGYHKTIGELAGMPVCMSLHIIYVDGKKILFYDPCSQVVDHRIVEEWLDKHLPDTARRSDGYINKTNAMNFHNVLG